MQKTMPCPFSGAKRAASRSSRLAHAAGGALLGFALVAPAGCGSNESGSGNLDRGAVGGAGSDSSAGGPTGANATDSANGGSPASGGSSGPTGGGSASAGATGSGAATGSSGMTTAGATAASSGGSTGARGTSSSGATTGGPVSDAGMPAEAAAPITEYYIGPNGSDSNPGTQAQPFRTLTRAAQLAKAGITFWMMPGTYAYNATATLSASGTSTSPIRIWAIAGSRPVLDYATQPRGDSDRGIVIKGNYWHVRGIEIEHAGDNGILISGSYNTIENVVIHENEDTGLQITVDTSLETNDALGANNLILNCDSYGNLDHATNGENADGFAAKLRIGPGNVFRGCRAWNNADDGWDLFAANDVVTIDGCWAFLNGKTLSGGGNPSGDGNGFKLGGKPDPSDPAQGGAVHKLTKSDAFENVACGFVRNNNPDVPSLSGCGARANPKGDYCEVTCSSQVTIQETGAAAKAVARNADGSLPPIQ